MEKTEAVNRLKKVGYQVQFDSSVVMVLIDKKASITQEIKKIRAYLQEIGYNASFGVKQIKDDSVLDKKEDFMSREEISEPVSSSESEKTLEIGEQFSLEDFGIS